MNILTARSFAGIALFATSTLAWSHGEGKAASTLYHYMTSPDHVIVSCMLGLAVVAAVGFISKGVMQGLSRRKR